MRGEERKEGRRERLKKSDTQEIDVRLNTVAMTTGLGLHLLRKFKKVQSPILGKQTEQMKVTLCGVWMGDRASRSVMGNSRPLRRRSSYTHTTPDRDGAFRKASAHD